MGFLVNGVSLPVFGEVAFRFGNLFALIIAIAFGPLWGTLSAVVASAGGVPHDVFLAAAEAFAVGWMVRRGLMPVSADLLFWLLIGAPCLAIVGFWIHGEPASLVWLRVAHQPTNGVLTAVLAEVLLMVWSRRLPGPRRLLPERRRRLRRQLAHWLALATIVPLLAVGLRSGRDISSTRLEDRQRSLVHTSDVVAQRLEDHLLRHRRAVEQTARFLEGENWEQLGLVSGQLESVRSAYPDFSTLLVAAADGAVRTGSPAIGPSGQTWWSANVSERGYFRRPMATGEPFISDVFLGRGFGSGAIIAVSAPVLGHSGQPIGVVEGSMDVRIFHDLARHVGLESTELLVLDRFERVLYSTHEARYPTLSDVADTTLGAALGEGLRANFTYERGEAQDRETLLVGRSDVGVAGWRVISQTRMGEVESAAQGSYLAVAFGLLAGIALATVVASGIAALVTRPLEQLARVVRRLDTDTTAPELPRVGSTAPRETAELVEGFAAMAVRLEHGYGQLRDILDEREALNWELEQVLADLDERVRERTHELAEARRRAEDLQEQYRSLIEGIEAIVWEFDLGEGRFTFVSRRVREISGREPEELYADPKLWRGILPKEHRREILGRVHDAIRRGQNHEIEYEIFTPDGERRWLRNVTRLLEGEQGRPRALRGVILDVTAIHRDQENQLRRRQLESVGTLAGGIAHDFNNLLTAILGNLGLADLAIQGGEPRHRISEHLESIGRASQKARDLSQKLLTFSKGGLPIQKPMPAEELFRNLDALVAGDSGIDADTELAPDLWLLRADRDQLRQVIEELIRNAVQAMPEGGQLRISARNVELGSGTGEPLDAPGLEPGRYVRMEVKDEGTGIARDDLAKVFDPYYTTKAGGRGFGLATAYSIVGNHGGHIEVRSSAGRGTVVILWLPAAGPSEVGSRPSAASSAEPGRVLLMDDEAAVLQVGQMMLRHLGWNVTTAREGREAVAAYGKALEAGHPFDLVISDLTVPRGMGGGEAIRRLRRIDPGVRAIVCSGYSNDPVMASCRRHGFVAVVAKPFSMAELKGAIAEAMAANPPTDDEMVPGQAVQGAAKPSAAAPDASLEEGEHGPSAEDVAGSPSTSAVL
ncbi:MAG: ATP-binding protein [Holophagales bacterium]|nr:ATP-binding protein [Holophagales bacterium]